MSSNLVAFILGAGSNVGLSVAAKLRENGYRVALGSRNPKPEATDGDDYFPVKVDAHDRESIVSAFETVTKRLGPVNVVIYNAASLNAPPIVSDFLSLPAEVYYKSASIGLGAFAAAQAALAGFRDPIHTDHPKAFIVTGNVLAYAQRTLPHHFTLGVQKALETRFIATAAQSYESENIMFYYAALLSKEGGIPALDLFKKSGPIHAKVYWDLINTKKQENWDHPFGLDGEPVKAAT